MARERVSAIGRRRVLKSLGAGAVGVGLAGCSGGGGSGGNSGGDGSSGGSTTTTTSGSGGGTTGGSTSSKSLTQTKVVLPHFGIWETSIGFLVGNEKNFFADAGLDVSKVDTSGGGGNVRAVVSGSADIGHATGIASLFAAYREGTDVRIVANSMNQSTDMFWYAKADSKYDSLDNLEGAKVAFSEPGSSTNMVALTATKGKDAKTVAVGGPPDANAALESGQVDMAWSVPPFFQDGINSGKYKVVFRGAEVKPFDNLSIRVDFAGKGTLTNKTDQVETYFAAYEKAVEWAYNNFDEAIKIYGKGIENDNYDLLTKAVKSGYPQKVLALDDFKGIDAANQIAVEFDFIKSKLSQDEINELFDDSVVPGASGDSFS